MHCRTKVSTTNRHYNKVHKLISSSAIHNSFRCSSQRLAKMHLTRHLTRPSVTFQTYLVRTARSVVVVLLPPLPPHAEPIVPPGSLPPAASRPHTARAAGDIRADREKVVDGQMLRRKHEVVAVVLEMANKEPSCLMFEIEPQLDTHQMPTTSIDHNSYDLLMLFIIVSIII